MSASGRNWASLGMPVQGRNLVPGHRITTLRCRCPASHQLNRHQPVFRPEPRKAQSDGAREVAEDVTGGDRLLLGVIPLCRIFPTDGRLLANYARGRPPG